jgi:hypothetical protein
MQIDKETVLNLLREQGKTDQAQQAEQELPDQVDTDRDAGMLNKFGINPQDLIGRFGGGNVPGF